MKQDRHREKGMTLLVLSTLHKMAGRDVLTENVVVPQLSLVLPELMRVAESSSFRCRLKALAVLRDLLDRISATDLPDYASGVVLPLLRVVASTCRGGAKGISGATSASPAAIAGGSSGLGSSSSSFGASSDASGIPAVVGSNAGVEFSSSSSSSSASAAVLSDRDTSELRNSALRCLTKAAKRLGPAYRPPSRSSSWPL
mmetsp:Transcript_71167/g.139831  ORF Transcript_71167/g.139831 Transcript_71167/m.139831 type:complete len:200 (+) Transcript_71167:672-1271(+)